MSDPGPFGWISNLLRWSDGDVITRGQGGPLPPPKLKAADSTDGDLYQGLADGWLHGTVGAALSSFFSEPRTRKDLYVLFEKMDMTDLAGSVLDQYAEDATQPDPDNDQKVWIEGPEEITAALSAMLSRLKMEDEVYGLARDLAKYGDNFERLVYRSGPDGGVRRMLPTPALTVTRKEDKEGRLEGYLQAGKRFRNDNSELSYQWDFAHFRLRGRDRRYPYGTSLLHNGMRPWKRAIVLEEWMLGYQVAKHPDRNLFLIDVGDASDVESADVTRRFRQKLKRHMIMDPGGTTNRGNLSYNYDPMTPMEDMVLPIRKDSGTKVQKLSGSGNATDIAPLSHTLDMFYSAVRAPKSFFGIDYTIGMPMNMKASLTNQDIRYARQVRRLQGGVKAGIRYLCELNLMLLMSKGDTVQDTEGKLASILDWHLPDNDFTVNMAKISFLEELERLEVEQTRQQVALAMVELGSNNPAVDMVRWSYYIFKEIVKIPEDELQLIINLEQDPANVDALRFNEPGLHDQLSKQQESKAKIIRKTDVGLTSKEQKLLSEALVSHPGLRKAIAQSKQLRKDPELAETRIGANILPDRSNQLFSRGLMKDCLSEADVQEMVSESIDESKRGV